MELVKLYDTNFRDSVAMLRKLADDVEAGVYGDVACVGVAMLADQLEVFGFGPDSEAPSVAMTLQAGALKLTMPFLHHGT